jgi:hypothetical protein
MENTRSIVKVILIAFWKILILTAVFFISNMIMGILLPLSNDLIAAMNPDDRFAFFPLFLLNTFINMTVLYIVLVNLRYKGWKLFFMAWLAIWGIFNVPNIIEIYWYNESFPLINYLDATKMLLSTVLPYGAATLTGTFLSGGFKKKEEEWISGFRGGHFGWRIILFSILYPPFYFMCGFIPWSFPEAREFYAGWAATTEPMYILLLFNIIRGALWIGFSIPLLIGLKSRKHAFILMPVILVTATAVSLMQPSAFLPGIVRFAHSIELTVSMTPIGIFMAWFFIKKQKNGIIK